jgi:DNA-binding transcriptional ArsR family regulator
MLRIHFTVEDLSRVRMTASLGAVAESVFALDLFSHSSGAVFNKWRHQVRKRLDQRFDTIERLARDHSLPDLLWLLERPRAAESRTWVADQDRQQIAAEVFVFCQAAVIPHWERIGEHLESVRDARGRITIANGVERMLSTLHPRIRWNPPVLEIPDEREHDLHLGGRGLVLTPSLFLLSRPCVVVDAERETGLPALVFATPATVAVATHVLDDGTAPEKSPQKGQALGALIGHTRAAALRVLAESCTTGELSARLGISLAGASKHATVLRRAGLITTERNRNTALHTLTSLGVALLQSRRTTPAHAIGQQQEIAAQSIRKPA